MKVCTLPVVKCSDKSAEVFCRLLTYCDRVLLSLGTSLYTSVERITVSTTLICL